MVEKKKPVYPFLENLSTMHIRAILFLDNEGDINHVPSTLKGFRKAIKDEMKRRLQIEIKYILKKHPQKKNKLHKDMKNATPATLQKQLQKMSMHKLEQLKKILLEGRKDKK